MKNPFLKRLMKDTKETVVHSSAYAKAQNDGGIGVTSTESFSERMKIDRNRTVVRRYGESRIVNDVSGAISEVKTYDRANDGAFGARKNRADKRSFENDGRIKEQKLGFNLGSKTEVGSRLAHSRTDAAKMSVRNNPGVVRKNPGIFR